MHRWFQFEELKNLCKSLGLNSYGGPQFLGRCLVRAQVYRFCALWAFLIFLLNYIYLQTIFGLIMYSEVGAFRYLFQMHLFKDTKVNYKIYLLVNKFVNLVIKGSVSWDYGVTITFWYSLQRVYPPTGEGLAPEGAPRSLELLKRAWAVTKSEGMYILLRT